MREKESSTQKDHIAIVGMACRFPGANNCDEFWENLKNGVNSIREIPPDRWDIGKYYSPDISEPNKSVSKWCGLVEGFDRFDHRFFGISSREAANMDPQQRMLLEETWHCIEDSGISLRRLRQGTSSVYVGISTSDYIQVASDPEALVEGYTTTGNFDCVAANRISHLLGLTGESLALDTGCASALYAMREAGRSLLSGDCDYAFAAAVNVDCHPLKHISYSKLGICSPRGQCRTFDKDADGFVPGEGVGVLLLQRLTDAIREESRILGIVKGAAVSHVGSSLSLTAPRAQAQCEVILSAHREAGFGPRTVTYVEAHGTGTSLGDPIEVEGLTRAFGRHTSKRGFCKIGSVKTNIGHLQSAAGMPGVIKILMMMRHRKIPPSLNFATPNPVIDFDNSPFEVATTLCDWELGEAGCPLRAGISAFGFGGANAHLLLEEPPHQKPMDRRDTCQGPWPFLLSAKSDGSLRRMIGEWQDFLRNGGCPDHSLEESCKTLMTGRESFPHRYGCLVSDKAALAETLRCAPKSLPKPDDRLICLRIGKLSGDDPARIRPFSQQNPLFRENLENLGRHLTAMDKDLAKRFRQNAGQNSPTLWSFLAGHAYLATLKDSGICPDIIVGESAGTWNSLVLAGVMRAEDTIAVLAGYKKPEHIEFSRPNVMLHIPAAGQTIMPYRIDESYIRLLTDDLRIPDDVFRHHVTKARLLTQSQFTFGRYMEEWDDLLRPKGVEPSRLLRDETLLSQRDGASEGMRLLLTLVIASSLSRLNRKWDLRESKRMDDSRFYEILSLISDGVMPEEALPEVLRGDPSDLSAVADIMNRRQNRLSHEAPYTHLKGHQRLDEIEDVRSSIREMADAEPQHAEIPVPPSEARDMAVLAIGECGESLGERVSEVVPVPDMSERMVRETLLRVWMWGADVRWERRFPEGSFQRVPLPTYPFESVRHWISKSEAPLTDHHPHKNRMSEPDSMSDGQHTECGIPKPEEGGREHIPEERTAQLYYEGVWERSEIPTSGRLPSGNILVFDTDGTLSEGLRACIRGMGSDDVRVLQVRQGADYRKTAADTYEIRPAELDDYEKMIGDLATQGTLPDQIIHFWSMDRFRADEETLKSQLNTGFYSVFCLTQAMIRQPSGGKANLLYAYTDDPDAAQPQYAALSGFLKSLMLERPGITSKTVAISEWLSVSDGSLAELLIHELSEDAEGTDIRYADGGRSVRRLREFDPEERTRGPVPLRRHGTYLITGGLGGLGMIFAEHLAETYQAKLALCGRSELTPEMDDRLNALRSKRADAIYVRADVSLREDAESLVREILARHGGINGVIHCAGTSRTGFIREKNRDEAAQILAPKVFGTVNLDAATREEELDFFVMFSSVSAETESLGFSDYAYANRFMDHFAELRENLRSERRRHGKTLSIGWPLWREGGMQIHGQTERMLAQTLGMRAMGTESGVNTFLTGLTLPQSHFLCMTGDPRRIREVMAGRPEATENLGDDLAPDEDGLLKTIQSDLTHIASEVLKIGKDDIDPDESLGEHGADSITLTELTNIVNGKYGLDTPQAMITPAVFFEHPTITALAGHLLRRNRAHLIRHYVNIPVGTRETTGNEQRTTRNRQPTTGNQQRTTPNRQRTTDNGPPTTDHAPVAIIGMSGVMPQSADLEEFWRHLENGDDLITEIPRERWDWRAYDGDPTREADRTDVRWGGFVRDMDKFDASFFGISPKEAGLTDPQQRIFLETAWSCVEDAGINPRDLAGTETGLFVGVTSSDYNDLIQRCGVGSEAHMTTGLSWCLLANRISYLLDLHGPSEAVDTACSGSLVAICRGVEAIRSGRCPLVIAGGVNALLNPFKHVSASKTGVLSRSDGRCKTFDSRADGYARGEGAGAVLLKPLARAEADGDPICAVIRGIAVNHGGRANSLTAPNAKAQAALLVRAYENGGVDPTTVGYMEAHGTGTKLGDPVETNGLKRGFEELCRRQGRPAPTEPHCGIGTVKTHIGHLESAAGIAGLLKTILAMRHGKIPGILHLREVNPHIRLEGSSFHIVTETRQWERLADGNGTPLPRRAGISSFGFGGTNAHLVLEEASDTDRHNLTDPEEQQIIVLSAKTEARLRAYAGRLADFLRRAIPEGSVFSNDGDLSDILRNDLIRIASDILKVTGDEIDPDLELSEHGFVPATLSLFSERISKRWETEVKADLLSAHPSISKLSEHLIKTHGERLRHNSTEGALGQSLRLADIAYTLQIGREPMQARLATVVSDVGDLIGLLSRYHEGEPATGVFFSGIVGKAGDGTKLLVSGRSGEMFVKAAMEDREHDKLAQLWVSGIDIDWRLLHPKGGPRRISLPTYPFARDRHWIPTDDSTELAEVNGQRTTLHPLVDRNTSTMREQRFTTTLTGEEFFLSDHVVSSERTFPGVAYIEMARAAGEFAEMGEIRSVRNVVWAKPLRVAEGPREVDICLRPDREDVAYEVVSRGEDGEQVVHGQGRLVASVLNSEESERIDIEGIRARCLGRMDGDACYARFEKMGLRYGPAFQVIREMRFNETEALSQLELPAHLTARSGDFLLHPSLADGALQTIAGFAMNGTPSSGTPLLPFSLAETEIHGKLPETCYAYATPERAGGISKFLIRLTDIEGRVLVRMRDFTVREVLADDSRSQILYIRPVWEAGNLPSADLREVSGPLLVFDADGGLAHACAERLTTSRVILIRPGEAFSEDVGRTYEIDPGNADDYHLLMRSLRDRGILPSDVIFRGDRFGGPPAGPSGDTPLHRLLRLSQAIMEQRPEGRVRLAYVYERRGPSGDHPYSDAIHAAVGGFARTIRLENPRFVCKTLGFGPLPADRGHLTNLIIRELASGKATEVLHEDGTRLVRQFQDIPPESVETGEMPLADGGVCLITGGLGGLGLIFVEHLAKNWKARLVLAGRSELPPEKAERLDRLRDAGADVMHVRADVSDREDAFRLVRETKSRFGRIDGVIHAAGVIRDGYLLKKTREEADDVLAPKMWGTRWLDEATRDEPLSRFILFSAVAGVVGNPGQCDYAYANCFMDHFAAARERLRQEGHRSGRTLSVSWPLWREGGMRVDGQSERLAERMSGMYAMPTGTGLRAFSRLMTTDAAHATVLYGDAVKIRRRVGGGDAVFEKKDGTAADAVQTDDADLTRRVREGISRLASEVLGMGEADVDPDADMSEHGFDSISLIELVNRVNDAYDLELMPVIFFEHPSVGTFAEHLCRKHGEKLLRHHRPKRGGADVRPKIHRAEPKPMERFLPNATQPSFSSADEAVAVIGMSGRMPQCANLDEFWRHLKNGDDLVTEIPPDRWDWRAYYGNPSDEGEKTDVNRGGFMRDVDRFDAGFFRISPREAELMDPQQRIFLEIVWECIEDAGHRPSDLSGTRTGLFVGVSANDYAELLSAHGIQIGAHTPTGTAHSVLANRISYLLNLRGPSEPVDTACSSSLVAIDRAVRAIRSGECESAIAGGVNVMLTPSLHIAFSKAGMLSKDGRCKTFDSRADGYVRGEGAGALLLRPLSMAVADGDRICGVIRGIAVNHGGHVSSLTVPNPNAQADVLVKAHEMAGIDPTTVGYVEAHGTGTALGDPVEVNGLRKAFKRIYEKWDHAIPQAKRHCGLGSVKTNIGHLEATAGIAGVIKVLLAMRHRTLPASLHFEALNPQIELTDSPFHIVNRTTPWDPPEDGTGRPVPRRAGVSSFGFGGSNAHVVIEEYQNAAAQTPLLGTPDDPQVIVLSARNEERLRAYARHLADFLRNAVSAHPELGDDAKMSDLVREDLIAIASDMLSVATDETDPDADLDECGFDPVTLALLSERVSDTYGLETTAEFSSEHPSLNAFVQHLIREHGDVLRRHYPQQERDFGKTDRNGVRLADVAWTLQIGREPMPARLAMVVTSVGELIDKLTEYENAKKEMEDFHTGHVSPGKSEYDMIEGEEGDLFLQSIIRNRKLGKLARLWVSGADMDWCLLHPDGPPNRISLPTYPFARDRHWIPETDGQRPTINGQRPTDNGQQAKLHPLIDRNTSTLAEQRFSTRLTGDEFYLSDHNVSGRKVLPGVTYLEMARAAAEIAGAGKIQAIENVFWTQPVIVSDEPTDLHVSLYPDQASGFLDYEVVSRGERGQKLIHGQGKLVCNGHKHHMDGPSDESVHPNAPFDINAIKKRCVNRRSGEECYAEFEKRGLRYGTGFQVIQEMRFNEREVLSELALPACVRNEFRDYTLHPSLMDGALQTAAGLIQNKTDTAPFLPFSLGRSEMTGPLTETCYAHATPSETGRESRIFDVRLLDPSGHLLVSLYDISMRPPGQSVPERTDSEIRYSRIIWKRSDTSAQVRPPASPLLIFDTDEALYRRCCEMPQPGDVILVRPGERYQETDDGGFRVAPRNGKDYERLLRTLAEQRMLPGKIIHLWSKDEFGDGEGIHAQLERGFHSLFHLSRAFMRHHPGRRVQVLYFHVDSKTDPQPQYAAVSGLAGTISMEHSPFVCKTIGLSAQAIANVELLRDIAFREFETDDTERVIRYENNARLIRHLDAIDPAIESDIPLKENGVYLITGGLGGLGLIFAEHLAKHFNARLALCGRSEMNDETGRRIGTLERLGAEVAYIQADVSVRKDARRLVSDIRERFGRIDGIIHSAGVIRDALIIKKTEAEMNEVFGPKVFGMIHLDHATREDHLDFFATFSSMTAVTGNTGQCDYAYANAFMDHFASMRENWLKAGTRSGRTLSLNWPLWEEGGMSIDERIRTQMEQETGMLPLTSEEGVSAFLKAIGLAGTSQVTVVKKRRSFERLPRTRPAVMQHDARSGEPSDGPAHDLGEQVRRVCSDILKVDPDDLEADAELTEYGMDSIMFVELKNAVERMFRVTFSNVEIFQANTINLLIDVLTDKMGSSSSVGTEEEMGEDEEDNGDAPEMQGVFDPFELIALRKDPAFEAMSKFTDISVTRQQRRKVMVGGRAFIDFASCNYLGYDYHPDIMRQIPKLVAEWGVHPSWTRAVASPAPYAELEKGLAGLIKAPDTLIFPCIAMLNIGVLPILAGPRGILISDTQAHHTIHEACQMAATKGITCTQFRHGEIDDLERQLARHRHKSPVIVTLDGVYSMSVGYLDLPAYSELARKYDAYLYVDDAHGFGVIGENPTEENPYGERGNGIVNHFGMDCERDHIIYVSGLSKAYSSYAAFISCRDEEMKSRLQAASNYIFSGPIPVASLASGLAGLEVNRNEGEAIRANLFTLTKRLVTGARELGFEVDNTGCFPIVFVVTGNQERTVKAIDIAWERGLIVTPGMFPAVPYHRGGLRFTVTALNTDAEIDTALQALEEIRDHRL